MCDQKTLAIDIETTGLTWPDRVLSVGVSYRNGDGSIHSKAWPITAADLFHQQTPIPQVRAELLPLIQQADLVIGHNITFDLSYLFKHGILLPDDVRGKLFDTLLIGRMTAAHESHSLASLCAEYGIGTPEWMAKKSKRGVLTKEPVDSLLTYQAEDTTYNLLLGEYLYDLGKGIYDPAFMIRESEFCRVMAEVRCNGMPLDADKVYQRIKDIRKKKGEVQQRLLWDNKIEGPNDKTGLVNFLRKRGITRFSHTEKGNITLDEKSILDMIDYLSDPYPVKRNAEGEPLEQELYYDSRTKHLDRDLPPNIREIVDVLDAVLACRGWEKEVNTWLLPFVQEHACEDGLVHSNYTVGGTESYRLSCSTPNLQAIPDLDIWQPHIVMDYSQAEYRLAALYAGYMTGDYALAEGYARGLDAHTITAHELFGVTITKDQRKIGKTINFASNYGAGADTVARQLRVSVEEARGFLNLYREKVRSLFQTAKRVNQTWVERGYIKLWTGKRIWKLPNERDYVGWNRLIQGGVAEIAKEGMYELDRKGFPMIGQVHDSIKFLPHIDVEEARECMSEALPEEIRNWTTPAIEMKVDLEYKGVEK